MSVNKHLSKFDEIAVVFVIYFDRTPRVRSSADLTPIGSGDYAVGTNNGERDFALREGQAFNGCFNLAPRCHSKNTHQNLLVLR